MNKQELINEVAESAGITKAAAALAINTITLEIGGALAKGDSVTLVGFGTFKVTNRVAREGRNPATGKLINIPARKAPVFVSGKALKEAVNSK